MDNYDYAVGRYEKLRDQLSAFGPKVQAALEKFGTEYQDIRTLAAEVWELDNRANYHNNKPVLANGNLITPMALDEMLRDAFRRAFGQGHDPVNEAHKGLPATNMQAALHHVSLSE